MPNVWGNFPAWGLTIVLILWLVLETVLAFALFNHRRASYILTYCIALFVLVFHIWYFIDQSKIQMYPVEFSHISYFVFSVCVVFGSKKMQSFAGFCGMLTGLAFLIAGCFSPQSMLNDAASGVSLFISVMRHEILWLGGLMLFLNVGRFEVRDIWIPFLGIVLIIIYSMLMYNGIIYPDFAKPQGMVIVKIVTGTILGYVTGGVVPVWLRVFTIILVLAMVIAAMFGFYKGNKAINKLRDARNERIGKKRDDLELGLFPLALYLFKRAGVFFSKPKTFGAQTHENCEEISGGEESAE